MCLLEESLLFQKQECLVQLFPRRTELGFERRCVSPSGLPNDRNIHFVQKRPILLNWRRKYTSWKKTIHIRSRNVLHIVSLGELSLYLEGVLCASQGFQYRATFTLFKLDEFSWMEETHVYLGRKWSVFKAGVSCTLHPSGNWVSFVWTTGNLSGLSTYRNIHFVQNRPMLLNWRNMCISWKKTMCGRSRSLLHIVSL